MKIFVLTGGGLAPALNATIYGVLSGARKHGWSAVGGMFGWASLMRSGRHVPLDDFPIETIRDVGGTILRASRTNPFITKDGIEQVKERLHELGIDAVVAIGGDDTLGAAAKLAKEGIKIIGIPKTIDNDLTGTYYTPGFPTAAHNLASFVKAVREDAAYGLARIFVVESFGMGAGWLSAASIYGGADVIIPPESEVHTEQMLELINQRYAKNGNFAVVVVSQEASFDDPLESLVEKQKGDQYGHVRQSFVCLPLKELIMQRVGVDSKALYPGNWLQSGKPIPFDRDMAIKLGEKAVELIAAGNFGTMPCVTRPDNKKTDLVISSETLDMVLNGPRFRPLPDDYFDYSQLKPTDAFLNYMEPMLGPLNPDVDDYSKLLKKFASQVA